MEKDESPGISGVDVSDADEKIDEMLMEAFGPEIKKAQEKKAEQDVPAA